MHTRQELHAAQVLMVERTAKRLGTIPVNVFAMALAAPQPVYEITAEAVWAFQHFKDGGALPDYAEAFCLQWLTASFVSPKKVKVS